MKIDVFNIEGNIIDNIELDDKYFNLPLNKDLVLQYLRYQTFNSRFPWAHTKIRAEVRGGGKKPWKQKGTGRARHGSIRSPQWKGGGVVFGPRNTINWKLKMPTNMRRKALLTLLSDKIRNNDVKVILNLNDITQIKTKFAVNILKNLNVHNKKVLIIFNNKNINVEKSFLNIQNVKTLLVQYINPKDLMYYNVILLDKSAIEAIPNIFTIK